MAELVVQDLGRRFATRYVTARFGNLMIELLGHWRSEDIDIVFTGLRPGEKLFEELEYTGEAIDKTRHPKIYVGKIAGVPPEELAAALASPRSLASAGSPDEVRAFLGAFLPEAQLGGGAPPPSA